LIHQTPLAFGNPFHCSTAADTDSLRMAPAVGNMPGLVTFQKTRADAFHLPFNAFANAFPRMTGPLGPWAMWCCR
jgi:hypothetical protein